MLMPNVQPGIDIYVSVLSPVQRCIVHNAGPMCISFFEGDFLHWFSLQC